MPTVYRLENTVQHYDWGSYTDIPGLLGVAASGRPEAELWLGAHPSAPSLTQPWDKSTSPWVPLNELIQQHPVEMLGARVLDDFGPRLPYLLKVLAADRPLSLQVHPAAHQARAGFNRENREGVPITAPHRKFKDTNHKPEMIVAVTEFHALVGLRAPRVVLRMLEGLTGELFDLIRVPIAAQPNHFGMQQAFTELLSQRSNSRLAIRLTEVIDAIQSRIAAGSQYEIADQTVLDLAAQHQNDTGILSPYLLNRVTLFPGEALFIDDAEVHAYLKGLGVEIMANSDNVLRAGLTSKPMDVPVLLESMSFHYKMPFRPSQVEIGDISRAVNYRPPAHEFALTMMDLHPGDPLSLPPAGPRILQIMEGEVTVDFDETIGLPINPLQLKRGNSIFIPDAVGPVQLSGATQAAIAWVP